MNEIKVILKQEKNKSNKGVKTMKKTTKKTTKKETFTQEATEKLYKSILEIEDTLKKMGGTMNESTKISYMLEKFDITEDEAKAFLDKMEKKETKAEEKKEEGVKTMTKKQFTEKTNDLYDRINALSDELDELRKRMKNNVAKDFMEKAWWRLEAALENLGTAQAVEYGKF